MVYKSNSSLLLAAKAAAKDKVETRLTMDARSPGSCVPAPTMASPRAQLRVITVVIQADEALRYDVGKSSVDSARMITLAAVMQKITSAQATGSVQLGPL